MSEAEPTGNLASESLDQSKLRTMVELQLSEMDMLQAMFPSPRELVFDDSSVLCDLRDFAECRTHTLPPRLEFVINLDVDKGQLNMSINLPHQYPAVQPSVFVRSQTLSREAQHRLNQDLLTYLKTIQEGDLCIGPAITWLQEQGTAFFDDCSQQKNTEQTSVETKEAKFARLWIYSHHIYSKVRSWNWQKILCKKHEEVSISHDQDLSALRKFPSFEELGSENNIRVKNGGLHVNMGDVLRYLEDHDCGYVFKDYFGISGRPT